MAETATMAIVIFFIAYFDLCILVLEIIVT